MSIDALQELKERQAALESQIAEAAEQAKKDGLAEIKRIAVVCNIGATEIVALFGTPKAKRAKAIISRYANPDDPSQTYAGKGKAPAWWHALNKDQRAACKVAA